MPPTPQEISTRLAEQGIFGPASKERKLYENRLTRFFEREFSRHKNDPQPLEALGISTERGPIMEETDALMEHHYDERSEFFASFLDTHYRAYSMAYYGDTPQAVRASTATLEEAQYAKFSLIAERARIQGHERIFNIGCGFGSLETFLLQEFPDLQIVGITPSKVQIAYLKERMKNPLDPLSSGRFTVIKGSFGKIPSAQLGLASYDLVMSIGVIEHVLNFQLLFRNIAEILVPGGRTFHHFITSQVTIPKFLDPTRTRIGLYFPGGRVWPHDEFARHTTHFDLVDSWFVNGLNYWRTLDEWHRRYWNAMPVLYGQVFDEQAISYWNDYFSLCKAVFAPMDGRFYGNSHYLFQRKN